MKTHQKDGPLGGSLCLPRPPPGAWGGGGLLLLFHTCSVVIFIHIPETVGRRTANR